MKYFVRYTRFAFVAILALGVLATSFGPAQAATPLKITDIYNPLKILRADLTIPSASETSLRDPQKAKTYVPATLSMGVDGRVSGNLTIEIRLKGTTSFIDGGYYDENPSFKIKFPKKTSPTGYLGL
ncbi:MAG: hypothetical protein ACKOFA_06720, partial [Rhodoluna sp.]